MGLARILPHEPALRPSGVREEHRVRTELVLDAPEQAPCMAKRSGDVRVLEVLRRVQAHHAHPVAPEGAARAPRAQGRVLGQGGHSALQLHRELGLGPKGPRVE
eukprot:11212223-Alexandrium_andersonii.AAC.1